MDMSPEENSRFNRLDKDDQLKLSAVMQMMAKEKDSIEKDARKAKGMMEEDKYDDLTANDSDLPTDELKNYVAKMYRAIEKGASVQQVDKMIVGLERLQKKAGIKEDVNEMTGDTLNRLDGLVDQPLLISFLDKFEEIYYDFIEQGEEFEVGDVIAFLEKMLYDRAEDARMEDQLPDGFAEASGEIGVDQQGDTTRDVNVTDDTSMYDPLKEAKTQMKTIMSSLKKNKGASDEEIKDFIRTHKDDIKDMTMSEIEDEFDEFISVNTDYVDEGVEFFKKIGGITPLNGSLM